MSYRGYGGDRDGGGGGGGRSAADRGCKVYVGNLGESADKSELEREFGRFGHVNTVWIARNPPGFAFVEFEDPRDASDAVRDLDSSTICGQRARVEISRGKRSRGGGGGFRGNRGPPRRGGGYGGGSYGGGGYGGGGRRRRSYSRSRSRSPAPRRGGYSRSRSRSRSR